MRLMATIFEIIPVEETLSGSMKFDTVSLVFSTVTPMTSLQKEFRNGAATSVQVFYSDFA